MFGFAIRLAGMVLAGLLCGPALALPDGNAGPGLDPKAALSASQAAIGRPVADYRLTDREGRQVRLSDYRGKPLLVSFVYTGCFQVCPTTTKFLGKAVRVAQDALGPDAFRVVTIGFNLPFDNPQSMRVFARRHGIDLPNWEFLSPEPATLGELTRDFGFTYAPTPKGFDHITQVTIVDADGRVYRQIYGDAFEFPMLVGPLKDLIAGRPTPAQDLGGLLEKVRLLCTVYDPTSGKYRINYALFIEIFVGLTILGGTLYYLLDELRRHRRGSA
jgi:protein SCO1